MTPIELKIKFKRDTGFDWDWDKEEWYDWVEERLIESETRLELLHVGIFGVL